MRRTLLLCLLLIGCSESATDRRIADNFPTSFQIPDCSSLDVKDAAYLKAADGDFYSTIDFRGSSPCLNAWASTLGSQPDSRGIILLEETDHETLIVVRLASVPNVMRLSWIRNQPIAGVRYEERSK